MHFDYFELVIILFSEANLKILLNLLVVYNELLYLLLLVVLVEVIGRFVLPQVPCDLLRNLLSDWQVLLNVEDDAEDLEEHLCSLIFLYLLLIFFEFSLLIAQMGCPGSSSVLSRDSLPLLLEHVLRVLQFLQR